MSILCSCASVGLDADSPQAKKYNLKNTPYDSSSLLTYTDEGYTDFTHLIDAYDQAYEEMTLEAGRLLAENIQDRSTRTGLALAGWNPEPSDTMAQAAEYWGWGKSILSLIHGLRNLGADRIGRLRNVPHPRGLVHDLWRGGVQPHL